MPAFRGLPEQAFEQLAAQVAEEPYPQGAVVLDEGAAADRLFLIAEGEVLVTTSNGSQQVPLCRLGEGEMFGEIGLLTPLKQRSARVTAVRPLLLATLARRHFQALVDSHPAARASLQAAAEQALVASLLRRASPFRGLPAEALQQLAARLEARAFPAGSILFRERDPGDVCYLVESGRVEVRKQDAAAQRSLAVLGPGEVVGEAALLTAAPRDASLVALDDVRVRALRRDDLVAAVRSMGKQGRALAHSRDRPVRAARAVVSTRATADGATVAVLQDPDRPDVYEQLSAPGLFVWEQLDGQTTVEQIESACRERFPALAADEAQAVVARLLDAGFAQGKELRPDVREALRPSGLFARLLRLFGLP